MVKYIIAISLLATTAYADDAFNMFGFRMGVGALPIDGDDTLTVSLGVGVEHPVFKKTRVFTEYEWLYFTDREDTMEPARHGNGHRVSLGLRRELAGKGKRKIHGYLDGEVGGGLALTNGNMTGVELIPNAFLGLRAGYDLYSGAEDSPSRTFEAEFLLRAIGIRNGIGLMFGVGMAWGN
jgi:hypothetical protein